MYIILDTTEFPVITVVKEAMDLENAALFGEEEDAIEHAEATCGTYQIVLLEE
jgi:hypothetical protein